MAIIIKGNPFTHHEEKRESMPTKTPWCATLLKCDWCGQSPKALYKYNDSKGWFCNKECHNSYHG